MNVTLTGERFLEILSKHYGMEVTGFTIINPDPSPCGKILRQSVIDPLDKSKFLDNIKSLRRMAEECGKRITLSEARWAVNNWNEFLGFVDRKNRLPKSGYGSGDSKGILM